MFAAPPHERKLVVSFLLAMLALAGCAEASRTGALEEASTKAEYRLAAAPAPALEASPTFAPQAPAAADRSEPVSTLPVTPPPAASVNRKIIYQAELSLKIESLDQVEPRVLALVKQAGGYISDYSIAGSPGSQRSARWQVRVPVETFDNFVVEVAKLGELEANRRTSQDVTAEFVDIEARVKNKRVEEGRIVKLLEERTGQLEDIIRIEGELSRVRSEIEQMEGRLRLLNDQTSLSTVTIQVAERTRFEPPPPAVASFGAQVQRTFADSVAAVRRLGESVVLFSVALVPWLPMILVGLVIGLVILRWLLRLLRRAFSTLSVADVAEGLRRPIGYNRSAKPAKDPSPGSDPASPPAP
jgi:hypothetical protein